MFLPQPRATLLIPSGPANNLRQQHLFVLLTGACGPANQTLLVPFSTFRHASPDQTCIVRAGSHEFITVDSVVMYSKCRLEPSEKLINGENTAEFIEKAMLDEEIFARVRGGFNDSKFAPPYALEFLEQYGY